ncbi:hypothetical protein ACFUIY_09380 [Streptomyces griseorubiginosus]|uniref:hypothetical protein n=1 Tax=Streptomyces griseorubiginosus TaxID=67304 RepID=UPI00113FEAE8|nr:hypothetical protein [Streptomyces griseorubiginosus]
MKSVRLFRADLHDENAGNGSLVMFPTVGVSCFVYAVKGSEVRILDVKPLSEMLSGPVLEIGVDSEQRLRERPAATASAAQHQAILVVQEEQENAAVGDLRGVGGCQAAA